MAFEPGQACGGHLVDASCGRRLVGYDCQFLASLESDNAARRDCDDLASFRIASRARALVTQLEIPEPCQFNRLTAHKRIVDFSEEGIDHVLRLAFI